MGEILRGVLGPVRLATVLQLVESELLTGVTQVDGGTIAFSKGKLVAAECGALRGLSAVYELFCDDGAEFVVVDEPVPDGPALGPMLAIVIEGCRLADEWARLAPLVLRVGPAMSAQHPLERALVLRLDGSRPLSRANQGPRAPIIDFVLHACETGALVEVPKDGRVIRAPTPGPAPVRMPRKSQPVPPPDYDSAMDVGRRHTREGAWGAAIQAFNDALAARPADRIALQNLRRAELARDGQLERSAFQWFRRS